MATPIVGYIVTIGDHMVAEWFSERGKDALPYWKYCQLVVSAHARERLTMITWQDNVSGRMYVRTYIMPEGHVVSLWASDDALLV